MRFLTASAGFTYVDVVFISSKGLHFACVVFNTSRQEKAGRAEAYVRQGKNRRGQAYSSPLVGEESDTFPQKGWPKYSVSRQKCDSAAREVAEGKRVAVEKDSQEPLLGDAGQSTECRLS